MKIVENSKIWFSISGTMVVLSIIAVSVFGLNLNIDFTGGSILEVEYMGGRPDIVELRTAVSDAGFVKGSIQPSDDNGVLIRERTLTEEEHQTIIGILEGFGEIDELRFDSIGPVIGEELKTKSLIALLLIFISIIGYVAFAFRKVSRYIESWKYGVLTVIAALHDIIIPVGVFAVLGHFAEVSVGTAFVAALLTVLGYSVNDTIVVFDRIRENLIKEGVSRLDHVVEESIRQTIARSINTSVTTLLALAAIMIFGGETTRFFILALIIGIGVGAYSSIFLASPLLVAWQKHDK